VSSVCVTNVMDLIEPSAGNGHIDVYIKRSAAAAAAELA
jgi:hypothetical protein